MKTLGIDPSSRSIGLAMLDGERLLWAKSFLLRGSLEGRLVAASDMMKMTLVLAYDRPEQVIQETPGPWARSSLKSSQHTVEVLAKVRGVIAAAAAAADIPCHEMTVNRARYLLFGKGNTAKHVVIDMLKLMGYEPPDEHAADALVVALAWQRERAFEERVAAQ